MAEAGEERRDFGQRRGTEKEAGMGGTEVEVMSHVAKVG